LRQYRGAHLHRLGGWLLRRGLSVTVARKTAVTFFAALMLTAIPAALVENAWLSIVSLAMLGYTGPFTAWQAWERASAE
jgi:hypothetical protein